MNMQAVLDLARIPLNDSHKVRYSDDDLLLYANGALAAARQRRPDLFYSSLSTSFVPLTKAQDFPLEYHYAQAVADYAGGRVLAVDDQESAAALMGALLAFFESGVVQ